MARLPDVTDLSAVDPRASRAVPHYPTSSPVAEATVGLGHAIAGVGNTVGAIANREQQKADTLNLARAEASWATDKIGLDKELDRSTDPDSLAEHTSKYEAALQKAAGYLPPDRQQLWLTQRQRDLAQVGATVQRRVEGLHQDRQLTQDHETLRVMQEQGPTASPEDRERIVKIADTVFSGWETNGYYSRDAVQKMRRDWANGYSLSTLQQMPPGKRLAALGDRAGGFEGSLVGSESSGNPRVVNAKGYAGLYQFGAPRLETLGLYTPGANENTADWQSNPSARWTGTFKIPGFPTVRTLDDFRNNTEAQRAAFGVHTGDFDQEITRRGLDRFIGKTVGGIEITKGSIYGMAHLGGMTGAEKFLKSDGKHNPDDGATSLADYARKFQRSNPDTQLAGLLTSEQRSAVAKGAVREIVAFDEQEKTAQRNEVAAVRRLLTDDLTSVERTGEGIAELQPERVIAAVGQEGAREWQAGRERAQRVYSALNGIETLPEGEVEQRLQALEPRPGVEGYAEDMQTYDHARKKAQTFLDARRSDPALAAEVFPAVKQARAGLQYVAGPNGGQEPTPESVQALIRARLAAQAELGIAEPMAVTKREAAPIARQLRYLGEDNVEGLRRFTGTLRELYGDQAPAVLSAALQHERVSRDLSVAATEVLSKLGMGKSPTMSDAERLDTAASMAAIEDAINARRNDPTPMEQAAAAAPGATGALTATRRGAREAKPEATAAAQKPGEFTGAPDVNDMQLLVKHRDDQAVVGLFEQTYGKGTAKRVLAEYDRRRGQPAKPAK